MEDLQLSQESFELCGLNLFSLHILHCGIASPVIIPSSMTQASRDKHVPVMTNTLNLKKILGKSQFENTLISLA